MQKRSNFLEELVGYDREYLKIEKLSSIHAYNYAAYHGLFDKVDDLFAKYKKLNEKDLYKLLRKYPKEEIRRRIFMLLLSCGCLLPTLEEDFTFTFEYIEDKYYRLSGYNRHFFEYNLPPNNHFLLISDTHIGSEIADLDLINYIYDYAVNNNISLVFHLGDIFHKLTRKDGYDAKNDIYHNSTYGGVNYNWCVDANKEYDERIRLFLEKYPNISEVKTIAILGNHDVEINQFYHNYIEEIDLRVLNLINPSFFFYPRDNLSWDNGPTSIRFSHRLYINGLLRDTCLRSEEELNEWYISMINIKEDYDLLISGHLHKPMITCVNGNQNLLISVPSTSKINIDGVVAYECEIGENRNIYITPIEYSKNKINADKKLIRKF